MKEFSNLLLQSLAWVEMGISVIPCRQRSKVSYIPWKKYQSELPRYEDLLKWFYPGKRPELNLAVVTGWRGLVVLDFDEIAAYHMWKELYKVDTLTVSTSRGAHCYLFVDQPVRAGSVPGVGDVKAGGGYVLGPGSIHPNNTEYKILFDHPIIRIHDLKEIFPFDYSQEGKTSSYSDFEIKQSVNNTIANDPWESAARQGEIDLITTIKQKFKIINFFPQATKKGDHWYITRCPLHDDGNPSMWIDTKRNLCGCYAGCNQSKSMDVINLISRVKNMTTNDSIEYLRGLL